uniref:PiggyBac transposable element-derived protein domain-containing protein n=1 Tax=Timema poppense TaxID=170557 RepID=A0A7R9H0M9_TIMPO|nr:unnamed protein product [Timema poppensis]
MACVDKASEGPGTRKKAAKNDRLKTATEILDVLESGDLSELEELLSDEESDNFDVTLPRRVGDPNPDPSEELYELQEENIDEDENDDDGFPFETQLDLPNEHIRGQTTEIHPDVLKKFGLGPSVVLHLIERLFGGIHFLFFDNYFTSFNLLEALKQKAIHAAGTVRVNRFAGPPLISDKDINKKERGFAEEICTQDGEIVIVKWLDNRACVLASNFIGIGECDTAKRIRIRSRKWTLKMIFHAVDLALTNSWLEYRHIAREHKVPTKEILDLLHFRQRVAEALIKAGKPTSSNQRKRGRPRTSNKDESVDSPPTRRPRQFLQLKSRHVLMTVNNVHLKKLSVTVKACP